MFLATARTLPIVLTVVTGEHHHIAIGIAEPNLSVLGGGVDVRFFDDLGAQAAGARHGRAEIADLEP